MTYEIPSPADPGWSAPTAPAQAPAPRAPEPSAAPPRPRKTRDPFFDNAKFLAILLVVIGHAIANLWRNPVAEALYVAIYLFHMPLFIVITGYFSRNWTFSGGKARKLITNVGVPYVIFETAYSLFHGLAGPGSLEISLLDPYYLPWFLLALFLWRLSSPVWQQIRWPLAVAVVFSLLSHMSALGTTLDLHRVFGLLPFYVLGLSLRPEHFELVKKPSARAVGAALLAAAFVGAWFARNRMDIAWLFWKDPHERFGVDNVTGTAMRLAMMVAAVVLIFAFLAVVPRRRTWFTALGATTLYAYLLHGFVIRGLKYLGFWKIDFLGTNLGVAVVIVGSVALGTFLCSRYVRWSMSWALEPRIPWAFTRLRRPANKPVGRVSGGRHGADRESITQ